MDYRILLAQAGDQFSRAVGDKELPESEFLDSVFAAVSVFKNILLSLLIIFVFYVIGKLIARKIVRALKKAQGESMYPDMIILINRFTVLGSLFVGFAVAIQFIFKLDFIQVVGFFGLGISFAFKDLLSNLIAGAAIIIQNRFRIGDFIQIGSDGLIKGKVMEIQTRATILKAIDGTEIIVPNSELMVKPVISYTAHHSRRLDFTIGIGYESDINHAKEVALEVLGQHQYVLQDPVPQVITDMVDESAVNMNMRFWIDPKNKDKSWVDIKSELVQLVKEGFDKSGINIPFPIRTLGGAVQVKNN